MSERDYKQKIVQKMAYVIVWTPAVLACLQIGHQPLTWSGLFLSCSNGTFVQKVLIGLLFPRGCQQIRQLLIGIYSPLQFGVLSSSNPWISHDDPQHHSHLDASKMLRSKVLILLSQPGTVPVYSRCLSVTVNWS